MSSVNKVILVGNLGADPDEIAGGEGCRFSIATNRKWKDKKGQMQEEVEWHRVVAWGKTGENCLKYLTKGRQVYVEGRIKSGEYTDNEGIDRRSFDIVAFNVTFLSGEASGGSGGGSSRRRKKKRRKKRSSAPAPADSGWGDADDDDWGDADDDDWSTESYDDDDIPF